MKNLDPIRQLILCLAVSFAAGLLFVNVYNSVVDAANWNAMLPGSIENARAYFKVADPGTFFRVASPINQLISLIALALCWKAGKRMRMLCAIALVLAVAGDMFTYAFFFPRNAILFQNPMEGQLEAIRAAGSQWMAMNWVRSAGVALNLAFNFMALVTLVRLNAVGARARLAAEVTANPANAPVGS